MENNKRYRNLMYIFEAWKVPEDIENYIEGHDFYPKEDDPRWLEEVDDLYALDGMLYYRAIPLKPGTIIVWNGPLGQVQDVFTDDEVFEDQYYTPVVKDEDA